MLFTLTAWSVLALGGPAEPVTRNFCYALVIIGDVDGDHVDDFVIGSPADYDSSGIGRIELISARTGRRLWTRDGPAGCASYGASLARLSDLDGDGGDDFVCGAPRGRSSRVPGAVEIVSTRSGAVLWSGSPVATVQSDTSAGAEFGANVVALPDADGDGRVDFVVSGVRNACTELFLMSSSTHTLLASASVECGERLPAKVKLEAVGDWGGDGFGDLAVTCSGCKSKRVHVRCGRDLECIRELDLEGDGLAFWRLRTVGDLDGDGVSDFAIPAEPWLPGYGGSEVRFCASRGAVSRRHVTSKDVALDFRAVDDMDGDERADYAVLWLGIGAEIEGLGRRVAALQTRSLVSAEPLLTIGIGTDANSDDWSLFTLPDVDADGKRDLGVVVRLGGGNSRLRAFSARTGRQLIEIGE
jgi:hypothetical protein